MTYFNIDKKELKNNEESILETARYLGYKRGVPLTLEVRDLIKKAIGRVKDSLTPRALYTIIPLCVDEKSSIVHFGGLDIKSTPLTHNLSGCKRAYIFMATIGCGLDALVRRAQGEKDLSLAAAMGAAGAMFCEEFVDLLNDKIKKDAAPLITRPRFSPGYGGVPLEVQKVFFQLLDCKKIGLSLMDTLVMSPEKSVTAWVGLEEEKRK